ncbi:Nucleoporin NUP37 [Ceratocystis lukuohia]
MSLAAPRIRRTAQNTQFTYQLSRRAHDVKTYPIFSPQGATIILYGHENGITVVWRGGRRLKEKKVEPAPKETSKSKPNAEDAVMVLDSDSDSEQSASNPEPTKPFVDQPEFEDEALNDPYPEIIQTLDLALGTSVLHIAVPSMTPTRTLEDGAFAGIEKLKTHMIFAVSCGTNDVYIVSVPLTPPSHESKARPELYKDLLADQTGAGLWGETLTLLTGQLQPSRGVAITVIKPKAGSKHPTKSKVIVASHTREASGALRLWESTLDRIVAPAHGPLEAFQTEFLPQGLSTISFNSTHTSHLLAVSPQQGVRVYDFTLAPYAAEDLAPGSFPPQGSWVLSLFQPFTKGFPVRKPIVDAAWIAYGRAILVLLADGTWGIWDVDGVSPKSSSLLGKNKSGVIGGAVTQFSASGQIDGTNLLRAGAPDAKLPRSGVMSASSVFAPGRMSSVAGGISVTGIPGPLGSGADESVALWINSWEHICVIPGILRFWDSQLRRHNGGGVNLFSGAQPTRMFKIHELSVGLMGEKCTALCAIAITDKDKSGQEEQHGLPVELAVLGESRLVLVRESEDISTTGGGLVVRKKFGKRNNSTALVVDRPDKVPKLLFDLNPGKAGTIRSARNVPQGLNAGSKPDSKTAAFGQPSDPSMAEPVPSASLPFMDILDAAADTGQETSESRDIEVEMLDIMEIDRQLDTMEDFRGGSRKRVMFDGGS